MKIRQIAKIKAGQDGAIYDNYLFRFDTRGNCCVYDVSSFAANGDEVIDLAPISEFSLDRVDEIMPHSNSVCFGSDYYEEGDEFPLLYTNVYNTYAKCAEFENTNNRRCGECCVYRIKREGEAFSSELVGIIAIGFTSDRALWRSSGDVADVRPYGNFVVDTENRKYWAYTMRDGERETRYFRFRLPSLSSGKPDDVLGIPRVTLTPSDIEEQFDVPYHNYVQGGIFHGGKVYEVEGFGKDVRAAIRVIDTEKKCEELYFDFYSAGYEVEPEFIDFYNEKCIYIDAHGSVFYLEF